jgi:uncharacterized protein YceK
MNKHTRFVSLALAVAIAGIALSGCGSVTKDGERITDFKASADSNARMYSDQADVQWKTQDTLGKCFDKTTTEIGLAICGLTTQATNINQTVNGRPTPNRNPTTGVEAAQAVGTTAVKTTAAAVTAVGVANAAADAFKSSADAQAQTASDGIAAAAKDPLVVKEPVVVQVPMGSAPLPAAAPTPTPTP